MNRFNGSNNQQTLISHELVLKLLDYDPDTGIFIWKYRDRTLVKNQRYPNRWNTRHAGNRAGRIDKHGYVIIRIFGKDYRAHRLAWLYVYGKWPKDQIDHENHNCSDNSIKNLRDVSNKVNGKNQKLCKRNTSGFAGVSFDTREGKWQVKIGVDRKLIHIGEFKSKTDAIQARLNANKKYGFHKNHGKSTVEV